VKALVLIQIGSHEAAATLMHNTLQQAQLYNIGAVETFLSYSI